MLSFCFGEREKCEKPVICDIEFEYCGLIVERLRNLDAESFVGDKHAELDSIYLEIFATRTWVSHSPSTIGEVLLNLSNEECFLIEKICGNKIIHAIDGLSGALYPQSLPPNPFKVPKKDKDKCNDLRDCTFNCF